MQDSSDVLVWIDDVKAEDVYLVGAKGAFLSDLARSGFPLPPAFIITSSAYREFLTYNNLETKIKHLLNAIDYKDKKSIREIANHIQKYIVAGEMPKLLSQKIFKAYRQLGGILKDGTVNLETSFSNKHLAGRKLNNIKGESTLLEKIKLIWSSAFSIKEHPPIIVSKVLENSISGVMLTDDFNVSKYTINDNQTMELVLFGRKLKKHLYFPQEIHWAIYKNKVYLTKIKPFTFYNKVDKKVFHSPLLKGFSFGRGVATGYVRKIINQKDAHRLKNYDIAVTPSINEKILPFLLKAKGVVIDGKMGKSQIDKYFRLSFLPVITETKGATKALKDGAAVTVNCALGEVHKGGFV